MKKDKEFQPIENLLLGKVKQPSPAFEEALRGIPRQPIAVKPVVSWPGLFKVAGIAAAISLLAWSGLDLDFNNQIHSPESILRQDTDLLTLFTLSNDLDSAAALLSEDNLAALDYLTSTP